MGSPSIIAVNRSRGALKMSPCTRSRKTREFRFLVGLNRELDEVRGLGRNPLLSTREVFVEVRREEAHWHVMLKEFPFDTSFFYLCTSIITYQKKIFVLPLFYYISGSGLYNIDIYLRQAVMMFLTCCLHFLSRALNRFSLSFFVLYIIEVPMFLAEKQVNPPRKNDNGFLHEDWWRDLLQENNYKEVDYSGKMVLLLDILKMSSSMGDKALVFSQSLSTLDLIEFYLSKLLRPGKKGKCWKKGKDWYRFDGRTESFERQKLVERFNEPSNRRVKCTLISTRAGSLGINLHAANRVIIVDGSWNPTYDLQAIYRVWRYGQTKSVFAYRLLAHGTMEEKIYKRQVTKEGLAARVVDRQQVHRTMSKEEMLHLFDFGDDENADTMPELVQETGVITESNIALDTKPELVQETGDITESNTTAGTTPELVQETVVMTESNTTCHVGSYLKQKLPLLHGNSSADKLMQSLISRHHPR
ncbi:protein CHROMATIN REMODELING 20-like [Olea europaea var. sylvestris]|uniref:protein CHROMATIN REMODELING 20-like n=1 Tax=Olea europaea var. sylvestris TaxID=158386 RepID=UPI000C1D02D3|nr:protein CHROMATIN REMODELING 20-like [Olea europaea var. sylvestris]